jgi:hypothetical protein
MESLTVHAGSDEGARVRRCDACGASRGGFSFGVRLTQVYVRFFEIQMTDRTPDDWFTDLWRRKSEPSDQLWREFVRWYRPRINREAYEAVAARRRNAEEWFVESYACNERIFMQRAVYDWRKSDPQNELDWNALKNEALALPAVTFNLSAARLLSHPYTAFGRHRLRIRRWRIIYPPRKNNASVRHQLELVSLLYRVPTRASGLRPAHSETDDIALDWVARLKLAADPEAMAPMLELWLAAKEANHRAFMRAMGIVHVLAKKGHHGLLDV